ncbi:tumor protein p53-inducible nuclear protein 1 [Spea bombifrons]|uniref:tumor protein p53-inducible nuclear protein 1 n=1 Tax=Spea bombifrons TaxID=233779 RepID=UPI00234A9574|nr:tumor protein p53-inducible nuclear protein 1 [Spea bombifrons]
MFQRLNDMFRMASGPSSREPGFSEKEDDDEWILVDLIVDSRASLSEDAATFEEISHADEPPPLSFAMGALERFENGNDSLSIHVNPPAMEESWFVTPPACFTARELTTIGVETSPMENLLIEHPSMSVYAVRNVCHEEEEAGCGSGFLSSASFELVTENEKKGQRIHCYVAARINYLEKTKTYHSSKLSRRQSEKHLLSRKSLRQQNLVHGCHPRQIKHKGLLVHQPCKRRYNY